MKYKVGDKVQVKSLDWYNENKNADGTIYLGPSFIPPMKKYCSRWFIIAYVSIENNTYKLKSVGWNWCDEFFEDIKEVRKKKLNKILDTNEI